MNKCQVETGDTITVKGIKPSHEDFKREYKVEEVLNRALVLSAKNCKNKHTLEGSRLEGPSGRTIAIFCFVEHQAA